MGKDRRVWPGPEQRAAQEARHAAGMCVRLHLCVGMCVCGH